MVSGVGMTPALASCSAEGYVSNHEMLKGAKSDVPLFHSRCRREREDYFTAMKDTTQAAYTQIRPSVPFDEVNATMSS